MLNATVNLTTAFMRRVLAACLDVAVFHSSRHEIYPACGMQLKHAVAGELAPW